MRSKVLPKKVIQITCQCGYHVALYHKGGNGRLRKMWFERIKDDLNNGLITSPPLPLNTEVFLSSMPKTMGNRTDYKRQIRP